MELTLIENFLKDITYNSRYEFIEMSKAEDIDEVSKKLFEKHNIVYPNGDLALFKCIYAYVDVPNANNAILPKEEVKKALPTLRGKSINFNHMRKSVKGYWLEAEMSEDEKTIYAYGILFKHCFAEDYDLIKTILSKKNGTSLDGKVGVSFEAFANRKYLPDGTYELLDIEFAGGGILIDEVPAFANAGILELSSVQQQRMLEFASTVQKPTTFLKDIKEKGNYKDWDWNLVMKMVEEAKRPVGEEKCWYEIMSVNFDTQKLGLRYLPTGTEVELNMKGEPVVTKQGKPYEEPKAIEAPVATASVEDIYDKEDIEDDDMEERYCDAFEAEGKVLTTKDRNALTDDMFAIVKNIKNKKTGNVRKIRLFPIHDESHVRNALARLEQEAVAKTLKQLGVNKDNVLRKILKRAKEMNMDELLKKYSQATVDEQSSMYAELLKETAALKVKIDELSKVVEEKTAELAKITEEKTAEVASLTAKVDEISKEAETAKAEIARRDAEVKAAEVAKKKEALGSFAEGMSDEDILDSVKYENAMLKKEVAELKATKAVEPVKAAVELTKGAADKTVNSDEFKVQKNVIKLAYGE